MGYPLYLAITGAPITTDNAPDASHIPAAARQWASPSDRSSNAKECALDVELFDGTSCTVQLWILLDGSNDWAKLGAAVVISAPGVVSRIANIPPNATCFLQVTAAAGNPTKILAGFVAP